MGWSATLKSNKDIAKDEIQKIINELPNELSRTSVFGKRNQLNDWGWSAATDIDIPCGNLLSIGGAYGVSEQYAESTTNHLKEKLEENGHQIEIEFNY